MNEHATFDEQLIIVTMRMVASGLSFIGSLFVMICILCFGKMYHLSSRIIFWMATMSLLEAVANLMTLQIWWLIEGGSPMAKVFCRVQGIMLQFTQIAEFGWITVIALNLFLVVYLFKNTTKLEVVYHIFVWGLAAICTLVPSFNETSYGQAGFWCWLTKEHVLYRWLLFYVPLLVMWLTVITFYFFVLRAVRHSLGEAKRYCQSSYDSTSTDGSNKSFFPNTTQQKASKISILLHTYPAIFVIMYAFPVINRIYNALNPVDVFWLFALSQTAPLLGFANAVAYLVEKKSTYILKCRLKCCPEKTGLFRRDTSEDQIEFSRNSNVM